MYQTQKYNIRLKSVTFDDIIRSILKKKRNRSPIFDVYSFFGQCISVEIQDDLCNRGNGLLVYKR